MPKVISILFGALFTVATAYSLGRLILYRLTTKLAREEQHLFGFVTGAVALSAWMFVLCCLHLVYDAVLLTSGALAIAAACKTGAFKPSADRLDPLPQLWRYLFFSGYAIFAVVCVLHAMAPEQSPDGSAYHLGVVGSYYRGHGFVKITSNMYANLSQGLELLFLHAWAFGRHSSAALVHCAFLLTLPLLLLRFGQRAAQPAAGAAAGLFVFFSPVVMVDGASAYNDIAVACVIFAIFYLCELEAPPALIGALAGFCYAMKYTACLAVVYVLLRYAWRRRWREAVIIAACAAVLILPWMGRNWIWFGNPFSPLMNAWFPNPYVHVSFEQDYTQQMRQYAGIDSYWQLPRELTINGGPLGGFLGPLFLLSPLALLGLRKGVSRRALAAALLFALPYAANVGTRFLLPSLPFVSFALAAGLPAITLPLLVIAHGAISFPDQPSRYCGPYAWRISEVPYRQAFHLDNIDAWFAEKWAPYRQARMVEQAAPAGAVVFAFSPIADSYTTRTIRAGFQSGSNEVLRDLLYQALIPDFQPTQQHEFTFPRRHLTGLRLVQTNAPKPGQPGDRDVWSISEFRILNQQHELPRTGDWRLTARPNPWDIQMAFDNSPITRWRSWEWLRPGMYVEVTFTQPHEADAVRLEMSEDQYGVQLKLEGRNSGGQWSTLSDKPVNTGLAPPLDLRRLATEELKRAGVTHLLISEDDFRWQDFVEKPALWHIREAGHVDNVRVYKLE
jgi:hypothetical protein